MEAKENQKTVIFTQRTNWNHHHYRKRTFIIIPFCVCNFVRYTRHKRIILSLQWCNSSNWYLKLCHNVLSILTVCYTGRKCFVRYNWRIEGLDASGMISYSNIGWRGCLIPYLSENTAKHQLGIIQSMPWLWNSWSSSVMLRDTKDRFFSVGNLIGREKIVILWWPAASTVELSRCDVVLWDTKSRGLQLYSNRNRTAR